MENRIESICIFSANDFNDNVSDCFFAPLCSSLPLHISCRLFSLLVPWNRATKLTTQAIIMGFDEKKKERNMKWKFSSYFMKCEHRLFAFNLCSVSRVQSLQWEKWKKNERTESIESISWFLRLKLLMPTYSNNIDCNWPSGQNVFHCTHEYHKSFLTLNRFSPILLW